MINLVSIRGKFKDKTVVGTGYITKSFVFAHCDSVSNGKYLYPRSYIFNESMSSPLMSRAILYCSNMNLVMYELFNKNAFERVSNSYEFEDSSKIMDGDKLTAIGYGEDGKQMISTTIRSMNIVKVGASTNISLHDIDQGWFYRLNHDIPSGMFLYNKSNRFVGWSIGKGRAIHITRFMDCVLSMKKYHESHPLDQYMWYQSADFIWRCGERQILQKMGYNPDITGVVITKVFDGSIVPRTGFLNFVHINRKEYTVMRFGQCYTNGGKGLTSLQELLSLVKDGDHVVFKYSDGDISSKIEVVRGGMKRMVPTRNMIEDMLTIDVTKATIDEILDYTGGTYSILNHEHLYRSFISYMGGIYHQIDGDDVSDRTLGNFPHNGSYLLTSIEDDIVSLNVTGAQRCNGDVETLKNPSSSQSKVLVSNDES